MENVSGSEEGIRLKMNCVERYLGGCFVENSNIDRILLVLEEGTNRVVNAYLKEWNN